MKKKEKLIDRPNFRYNLLKSYVNFALTKVFYKRFTVTKEVEIPKDVPVVFAANHQNALMDALVIISASSRQPVFFARADIFKKKLLSKILFFLRIAPLFRIRDGRETLSQNSESFDLATGILSRKNTVGIFPEGTHHDREQLIPLKKGMARMVLQAEQLNDFQLGVHVVPVSIAYLDFVRPRSEVMVHFGKPLTFTHLKDLYETNPSSALVKLNEEFEIALKEIVIHIETKEQYDLVQKMKKSVIYDKLGTRARLRDSFAAGRGFVQKMNELLKNSPEKVDEIFQIAEDYYKHLELYNINEPVLFRGGISVATSAMIAIMLLVGFPLFVAGRLLNYLPFLFMYRFVNKKIEDTQFRSSVYFAVTGLIVAPLMYLIQASAAAIICAQWWVLPAAIPAMVLLGVGAYQYLKFLKWAMLRWKANIFVRRHPEKLKQLTEKRLSMIAKVRESIF
jgi:1-acyl-sn-glycerol-3-phosphate acyltransferase